MPIILKTTIIKSPRTKVPVLANPRTDCGLSIGQTRRCEKKMFGALLSALATVARLSFPQPTTSTPQFFTTIIRKDGEKKVGGLGKGRG